MAATEQNVLCHHIRVLKINSVSFPVYNKAVESWTNGINF